MMGRGFLLTRRTIPSWLKLLGKLRRGAASKIASNRTEPHGSVSLAGTINTCRLGADASCGWKVTQIGVPMVRIGCHEFECIGDKPPQDHPHIYLNMGDASEIVCPYCSTLFRFDPTLGAREADPVDCAYVGADWPAAGSVDRQLS
jgi:uncharacterized Zn-finger protein